MRVVDKVNHFTKLLFIENFNKFVSNTLNKINFNYYIPIFKLTI